MPSRRTLLVEGKNDEHVLMHICRNRGGLRLDEIRSPKEGEGGVDRLLDILPARLRAAQEGEIVGVILDADDDLSARWQSLRDLLGRVGYRDLPEHPHAAGTIVDPPIRASLPRVGIWIMPDNRSQGILEDFLRFLIPPGSPLLDHVETSVAGIPKKERRFSAGAKPKAIIHTWLAWQKEPGKPLGTAITARYLDPDVEEVDVLVRWLKRLFFTPNEAGGGDAAERRVH